MAKRAPTSRLAPAPLAPSASRRDAYDEVEKVRKGTTPTERMGEVAAAAARALEKEMIDKPYIRATKPTHHFSVSPERKQPSESRETMDGSRFEKRTCQGRRRIVANPV